MLLENLPKELLTLVIERLSLRDRHTLRKTSRTFHRVVEPQDVLPLETDRVYIDFLSEALVVLCQNAIGDFESFSLANERKLCQRRDKNKWLLPLNPCLKGPFRTFTDVGENWRHYLVRYINKKNRHCSQGAVECALHVDQPIAVPEEWLELTVNFQSVSILTGSTTVYRNPLPKSLETWISKYCLFAVDIKLDYLLTPSQLDLIKSPRLCCVVSDAGAVHLLQKFTERQLPKLERWECTVEPRPAQFLQALQARGVSEERIFDLPSNYRIGLDGGPNVCAELGVTGVYEIQMAFQAKIAF